MDEPNTPATGDGDGAGASKEGSDSVDFVRAIVREDLAAGRHSEVVTRFPPEPNGYLHIGHAKAICLDFALPLEFGGHANLRFDDTNPETEDPKYVEAIKQDIRWLGYEWAAEYYASDYFEQLYAWAEELIQKGVAYVDDSTEEEIRAARGTVTEPGIPSPYRDRSIEENLDLFRRMRAGEFADGAKVLRARIDMAHPNMKMRDPLMYRIRHASHYRRGDDWVIYPFYDWAHGQSDAIEEITHSLCTLEFENNRELYDWFVDHLDLPGTRPRQFEFARLNIDYTIMSKRKLLRLVQEGHVVGWDDPRMPTLAGMRRRGVTPEAIRRFCDLVGVAKADSRVDPSMLEYAIRDDLNHEAPRVMCVLRPLKVVITDYPVDQSEELDAPYWPHDVPKEGTRAVPFSREIYIERDDFRQEPPKKFFRLAPGREVRLRYAYVIRCDEVIKDESGEVIELRCRYDPETRGGSTPDGRRIRGTIHWVSAEHAVPVQVRLYDRLFSVPEPGKDRDLIEDLNPESLVTIDGALAEPSLAGTPPGSHVQFERLGYFFTDPVDSTDDALAFNRVVTLRDTWAKVSAAAETDSRSQAAAPDRGHEAEPADDDAGDARRRRRRSPVEARAELRAATPELAERYERYRTELGLPDEDADVLTGDLALARFFDDAVGAGAPAGAASKWVVNQVLRSAGGDGVSGLAFDGAALGRLVVMIDAGQLSTEAAKKAFSILAAEGGEPADIVAAHGLDEQVDSGLVDALIDRVLADSPDKVEQFRAGQHGLLGFFMGQVMREAGAGADPRVIQERLRARLSD